MKPFISPDDMRRSAAIAFDLMLAPMVIAMRLPLMAKETRDGKLVGAEAWRAIVEKNAALAEGIWAAQFSLMRSATIFWFDVFAGRKPSRPAGAISRSAQAALKPASRRVKANFRRLSSKR
ncbi:hypothetical protein [Pseudaminobacter soli (ex Li et al. 2025)]|uniref:Uncharacterized protein n=1 Tax=Pseudaminobacter soli (ex Li et al. 2025) TaxID=1295366 RepID=A0A2P7SMZ2_9HYPH|nr:hypothetical protein [Mesorhizobium soli]PSJ63856.1 hypothetical protein C7I85_01665 [Mesorhizobium soli]